MLPSCGTIYIIMSDIHTVPRASNLSFYPCLVFSLERGQSQSHSALSCHSGGTASGLPYWWCFPLQFIPWLCCHMLVWENKFPHNYLTISYTNRPVFQSSRDYYGSSFTRLTLSAFALTGHNLPWDLSDLSYNLLSFYSRPHADALNLSSACLLVPRETWPLTSVSFLEWSCSLDIITYSVLFLTTLMTWSWIQCILTYGSYIFFVVLHSCYIYIHIYTLVHLCQSVHNFNFPVYFWTLLF